MTNGWCDIANTDVVLVMGGNPAENHPVGFRFVMEAKRKRKAKLICIDPRFNRTAAVSDSYVPLRAGTDIAFLGGLIRYTPSPTTCATWITCGRTPTRRFCCGTISRSRGALLRLGRGEEKLRQGHLAVRTGWRGVRQGGDTDARKSALHLPADEAALFALHARKSSRNLRVYGGGFQEGRCGDLQHGACWESRYDSTRWAGRIIRTRSN